MPLTRLVGLLLAVAVVTAGCGHTSSHEDPTAALRTAQQKLEQTSGVSITLGTDDLPDGVQGLRSASGTVTDTPAYEGTLGVVTSIGSFSVPVRSVDGKVYARIPLRPGWSEVDPSDYGAPDPADLLSRRTGVPALLDATSDLKAGKDMRGGEGNKEVLSTYTGTVPGSAVSSIIPGATGTFDATYAVASGGELRQATLTGVFYAGHPANTYRLVVTGYGTTKSITAP